MTGNSYPILPPEERRINEIISSANAALDRDLWSLIRSTQGDVANQMGSSAYQPPDEQYFAFACLQSIFLRLCGADSATMKGGDPALAKRITDNLINVSKGWSAKGADPHREQWIAEVSMELNAPPSSVDPRQTVDADGEAFMAVRKLAIADAQFERSPGQDGEVFTGNIVDERHGGPVTIGYGRYGPNQTLRETIAVDDVMIVLEGQLTVSTETATVTAGPGEIVYMPKGEAVTILSHEGGAVTAYVTYPHWKQAHP